MINKTKIRINAVNMSLPRLAFMGCFSSPQYFSSQMEIGRSRQKGLEERVSWDAPQKFENFHKRSSVIDGRNVPQRAPK
jgi:hypothetical protein